MKIFISTAIGMSLLMFLILAPAIAGQGPDEIEPNDTMELADFIDSYLIQGHMDEDDEADWYVLDGQEGYYPTFTIFFDGDEVEIDWEIYSDDEFVEGAYGWDGDESITCEVPGECYIYVYWYSGEGDYEIEIEPERGECEGEDEVEPNDNEDLADIIEDELEIHGYMCIDDEDWFVLAGQEGFEPTFTIYFDEDECEIDFWIYSDDELVGEAIGYGSGESITCEVPGECFIYVYYWDGEGEYTIEIEPQKLVINKLIQHSD